jgi:hypothetical protein
MHCLPTVSGVTHLLLAPVGWGCSDFQAPSDVLLLSLLLYVTFPADPAAEAFGYPVSIDIRDLVSLEDVMGELQLGPNG